MDDHTTNQNISSLDCSTLNHSWAHNLWSSVPWSWNLSWNDISLSSHALKIFTLIFKTKHCIIFFFYLIPLCLRWSNIPIVFLNKSRLRFWFTTFEANHLCLLQLPEIDVLTACLLKYSRRTSRVLNGKFTAGSHDSKEISLCDIFKIHI